MFVSFNRSFQFGERPYILTAATIVASAQIWYKADTNATFQPTTPTSGTGITQWNDSSNAAHNANPSGAGLSVRPTWQSNVINGLGAVQFNGVAQNLQISNTTWAQSLSGYTMAIVLKANALSSGTTYFVTNSDQSGFSTYWNGSNWVVRTAGGTGTSTIAGDTNTHILIQVFDGTQTGNDQRLKLRYNEAPVTLNFGATTVGTSTSASTSKLNFGWDGTGNYYNGYLAEVMLWTTAKDSSFVQGIEDYLSTKWNL